MCFEKRLHMPLQKLATVQIVVPRALYAGKFLFIRILLKELAPVFMRHDSILGAMYDEQGASHVHVDVIQVVKVIKRPKDCPSRYKSYHCGDGRQKWRL